MPAIEAPSATDTVGTEHTPCPAPACAANDGISSITFSPTSNLMVGTFWNNQVCCWDVQANGQAIPKASMNHEKPVLCSAWSPDGTSVFSGKQAAAVVVVAAAAAALVVAGAGGAKGAVRCSASECGQHESTVLECALAAPARRARGR